MKLFVSALEPSSNLHLSYLLVELRKHTDITLCGVFSSDICDDLPLYTPEHFSLMGFVDVAKKIFFFVNANKEMHKLALSADKILLMDSSSFNIPLAKKIKKSAPQKEIMYYILPQVWAWKPWRVKTIEQYCDKLAAILPFETSYYEKKALFVGHPLLDEITMFRQDSNAHNNIISFMPGSRIGEISRIFPVFRKVKNVLLEMDSTLLFNLVVPRHFKGRNLNEIYGDLSDFNITFDTQQSLYVSKFAFICSGTATLECALIGTPFVLGYKAKWLDEMIVKHFLHIKYVGLANILYNKLYPNEVFHQELLQKDLNVENLILAYNNANDIDFIAKSIKIRNYLQKGSAKEVANWLSK